MYKILFFLTLLFWGNMQVNAQIAMNSGLKSFWEDINGSPLKIVSSFNIEGSPYYSDSYRSADVFLTNGKKYENISCKINLQTNEVLFLNAKNEEISVITPIKEIRLYESLQEGKHNKSAILRTIDESPINSEKSKIAEVLVDGDSVSLYKNYLITYTDTKAYADATLLRTYRTNYNYYGLKKDSSKGGVINRNKRSVIAFFDKSSFSDDLKVYINKNQLSFKTEIELIEIFTYVNTLK